MLEHVSAADAYVYHYTSAAIAENYLLKDFTLKFGSYSTTNDPKETKTWEFGLITFEDRDLGGYKHSALSAWFSNELKSRAKLACFAADRGPLSGDHMKDIYRRGYVKARMWAQYGDKHTGVCVAFHRERLLAAVRTHFGHYQPLVGPVHYHDAASVRGIEHHEFNIDIDLYESLGPSAYVRAHIQRHAQRLFFEKLADWRDESEWRIVLLTGDAEPLFLPVGDSLVAVVHGDSTDPDCSERLMALTKGRDVQHLGISWKNSPPWYDYASFNWIPGKITRPRRVVPSAV